MQKRDRNYKVMDKDCLLEVEKGIFYIDLFTIELLKDMEKFYKKTDLKLLEKTGLVRREYINKDVLLIKIDELGMQILKDRKKDFCHLNINTELKVVSKEDIFLKYRDQEKNKEK